MRLLGSHIIIFCLLKIYPQPGFGVSPVGWLVRKRGAFLPRRKEDRISLLDFLATSMWACTWDLAGYLLPTQPGGGESKTGGQLGPNSWLLREEAFGFCAISDPGPWESHESALLFQCISFLHTHGGQYQFLLLANRISCFEKIFLHIILKGLLQF